MSKKSGIVKWISRLIGYGYVNPDDGGKDESPPPSINNGGGLGKSPEEDAAESTPLNQGKEPQAGNAVPDAE
jgi:hypothetical protein